jgi:DNA primase
MRAECRRAHAYLLSDSADARQARRWLNERGLTDATIRRAGLGFNPNWERTGFRDPQTRRWISVAPGIVIPCAVAGALWAVHVRTLPGVTGDAGGGRQLPKYLFVRGSKTGVLYNGDALQPGCTVLIVEGEFDALLAQQALGDDVVVVTAGSAANRLARRWVELLRRSGQVYSCFDRDAAGQRASTAMSALLGDQHQPLTLPSGKDVTDFVVKYGGDLAAWWQKQTEPSVPQLVQQLLPGGFFS